MVDWSESSITIRTILSLRNFRVSLEPPLPPSRHPAASGWLSIPTALFHLDERTDGITRHRETTSFTRMMARDPCTLCVTTTPPFSLLNGAPFCGRPCGFPTPPSKSVRLGASHLPSLVTASSAEQ